MLLITILVVLVVQRFANMAGWLKASWFEVYVGWLRLLLTKCNKWLAIVVVILPVFVILGVLHNLLSSRLFGLFYLVLAAVVLLLCMDARNLKVQLAKYLDHAASQNTEAAANDIKEVIASISDEPVPQSLPELNRFVTKLIFIQNYTQIFSVLFWFVLFGIYGASGYAVIALLRRTAVKVDGSFGEIASSCHTIQNILDWVPVRVLGLSYALVGQFTQTFGYIMRNLKMGLKDSLIFSVGTGLSSLGSNLEETTSTLQENYAALSLIDRAMIVWIMIIALITLGMLL